MCQNIEKLLFGIVCFCLQSSLKKFLTYCKFYLIIHSYDYLAYLEISGSEIAAWVQSHPDVTPFKGGAALW